MIDQDRRG